MPLRIFCTIFLLISVCALPLFFTVAIGLFAIIWFRDYYEIIPLAFLNDVLYGLPMERFFFFPYVMTLLAAVFVCVRMLVRRQMFNARPRTI